MAIEIVDLPTKNGGYQQLCKRLPEGIYGKNAEELLVDYFLPWLRYLIYLLYIFVSRQAIREIGVL